ncbi:40S ribosomal protein S27-1, putative [Leishmania tarentolae]|uniref:40S ribosomal protein S27-1, putative n=1 Tax=Leishmania tarentolae TaxID=5689 RepID=A0A640KJX9_LEITA|nr:40S ribosomal protein S27-1, putative [Leishmania tarentolae]
MNEVEGIAGGGTEREKEARVAAIAAAAVVGEQGQAHLTENHGKEDREGGCRTALFPYPFSPVLQLSAYSVLLALGSSPDPPVGLPSTASFTVLLPTWRLLLPTVHSPRPHHPSPSLRVRLHLPLSPTYAYVYAHAFLNAFLSPLPHCFCCCCCDACLASNTYQVGLPPDRYLFVFARYSQAKNKESTSEVSVYLSTMGFFDADLSYPTVRTERMKHKRRRLVQGPNSYFMDVICPQCRQVTVVYSHATTSVACKGCSKKLCRPTGGKALLVGGCGYRRKPEH